ncbi:L,D-transpeptidase family protein [Acetobacteraceae bacterium KSS12]|uniref:L,D-transpeptidase family protein n=2 Tax=Rhizosaccharibacter radicis TaxID=2782605 RepID=A0ABT1VV30_9PROT|nr:L,D-transpeptidase family protein [Acetobacteraceae bacterium KSS12]
MNGLTEPAVFGAAGIVRHKEEGDGGTPAGRFPLHRLLFRADRLLAPPGPLPREPLSPGDGWCDDPAHPDYNRQVSLPHPARHERLWRDDHVYDVVGVLGHNDDPPVPRRGSAIFLHLCRPDRAPTEGCIALEKDGLWRLLAAGLSEIEIPA